MKQAGDAQHRLGLQFQRIAKDVVHPPQHGADGLEPVHRLEPDATVTNRDVARLHQRIIQIMGQIGVLEIRFVGRAGSEDDGSTPGRGEAGGETRAQRTEKQGDAVDLGIAVEAGQHPRHHDAVLQGIAGPGRRLGAVAQHAHRPVRAADQVRGVQGQMRPVIRDRPVAGTQEAGVRVDQLRGQQPVADQPLRAVQVRTNQVEQFRALDQPPLDRAPFLAVEQHRHDVERPRPAARLSVGIDVVGDPVLA